MNREIEVYLVQRWRVGESPAKWEGDEYLHWELSAAEEDLLERGYVQVTGPRNNGNMLNALSVWRHPKTNVCWGLSAS